MPNVIVTEVKNKVGYIRLNRPGVFNALSTELMEKLKKALIKFDESDDVHCVVLQGEGKGFSAGADIKEFANQTDNAEAIIYRANLTQEIHLLIPHLSKPIIASVHGFTLAGGCGIALACDLVIAADNTSFSYPEIKRGFVPAIVTPNLTKITSRKHAFEMLISGKKISANDAYDKGLINKVVPLSELSRETIEYAEQIANQSLQALQMTKELFYSTSELPLKEGITIAKQSNIKMRQTKSFAKGVEDFMKKRG